MMGLFDRLRGDPMKRAEKCLAKGDARGAVEALERAPASPTRDAMLASTRATLIVSLIAKADHSESDGFADDALEWLNSALEEIARGGEPRADQTALEARAARLQTTLAAEAEAHERATYDLPAAGADTKDAAAPSSNADALEDDLAVMQWEALVAMLRPSAQAQYEAAGPDVVAAVARLHGGDVAGALESFDRAVAEDDGEPSGVLALERGRAYLVSGDLESAARDLDRAWTTIGDEPLDSASSWSVPQLWAEAMLDTENVDSAAVVTRLDPLVSAGDGSDRRDLAEVYGRALLASGRAKDAVHFLQDVLAVGSSPPLVHLMVRALESVGQHPAALGMLETTVKKCCASGTCAPGAFDGEAVRMLVGRLLHRGDAADVTRSHDLLTRLIGEQQGQIGSADCSLLARYFRAIGDDSRADEAEAAAKDAARGGDVSGGFAATLGAGTSRAPL